jgi:hypothetical protein
MKRLPGSGLSCFDRITIICDQSLLFTSPGYYPGIKKTFTAEIVSAVKVSLVSFI